MRTLILVVFSVFVLSLGYMAYWWKQPPDSKQKAHKGDGGKALPLAKTDGDRVYGPGKNVWVKKFNEDTAKLASRFKADDYQPRNDGWVTVKQPRAQFFMNDGRAISVEGESGEVIMDQNKTGMKAFSGSGDTPSRGRLYGVTVYLYHDIDRPEEQLDEDYLKGGGEDAPKPGLTIKLNNASFDNQTFKIYSEAYKHGKTKVEADQVPVTLRGDDYDFDGKGLVIRWNERDRRLQLLEVAHGQTLTIKKPNTFMRHQDQATPAPAVAFDFVSGDSPLPFMLAAKSAGAAGEAIKGQPAPTTRRARPPVPKPKITPITDPPLYRAIFNDNVKIVQGEDLMVTANKMSVDFLMQDQDSASGDATTRPTTRASRAAATTAPAATQPGARRAARRPTTGPAGAVASAGAATQPAVAGKRPKRPSSRPADGPTTEPAEGGEVPVVVTWTGKLVVEPLGVGPENPIKDGDAVVRLEGTPVTAVQQGSTILSGTLTYRTEDQAMLLTPMGPDKPVVMTDTKGSVVKTPRMDFFQPKHQAILYGASNAVFPQVDDAGKATAPMLAKWSKTCTLYFVSQPGQGSTDMNIERAELDGDVDVNHPQLKLKSNALELAFDTTKVQQGATTRPTTMASTKPASARRGGGGGAAALDARLVAVRASISRVDGDIATAAAMFAGANPDAVVQAKATELEKIEGQLALQNKAIKDLKDAGRTPGQNVLDEMAATEKQYNSAKATFEQSQKAAVAIQDLRGEREALLKQGAEVERQTAAAGRGAVTRPAQQLALGTATRPTTRAASTQATPRPTIRSDLRQLVATGAVHCEMTDSAQKTQTIDCNRLTLQTATAPDGKIYPNTVNADGEVHAVDPDQDLRAGHLAVALRPSTQPSKAGGSGDMGNAELQSLIAHQNVKVISKDGTIALADQLLVDNKDGKNNLKLLGQPFAKVIDKKSTLTGPIIEMFPDSQRLEVVGGGNMKGVQQDKPNEAERPIDVTWVRGLSFDGKANTVDVTGQVVAITTDADGATNTARGERMRMLLADSATTRPTTRATTQPTAAVALAQPTTRPTTGPASRPAKDGQYGGMASKIVRHITFDENATINSVTMADDGSLLRRTHLEAATVQYDLLVKKLLVPVEGRMVVEDHRPTSRPVAGAGAPGGDARPAGNKVDGAAEDNRGSTAFQWTKRFTYEDATRQAVMEGDPQKQVVVVHRDDKEKASTYRLTGDTVTADLEEVVPTTKPAPNPTVAVAATGPAATQPAEPKPKVQLKRVTATGHLLFTGPGAEIRAMYMEYDPKTHWLIARGNERDRVDFTIASQPGGPKLAEEVRYNMDTGEVRSTKMTVRMGR